MSQITRDDMWDKLYESSRRIMVQKSYNLQYYFYIFFPLNCKVLASFVGNIVEIQLEDTVNKINYFFIDDC